MIIPIYQVNLKFIILFTLTFILDLVSLNNLSKSISKLSISSNKPDTINFKSIPSTIKYLDIDDDCYKYLKEKKIELEFNNRSNKLKYFF